MSATIILRATPVSENRAELTAAQISRTLEMGVNWNVMRIGLQLCFNATVTATGTPLIFFGLSSGVVAGTGFNDGSGTVHAVGGRVANSSSWGYNAGPPAWLDGSSPQLVKKIGATQTTALFNTSPGIFFGAQPLTARSGIVLQITKGSPNFTMDLAGPKNSGAAAQIDCTEAKLTSLMEMGAMSDASSIISGYGAWGAGTLAVNEASNGYLDSICLVWDKSVPPCEISAVMVRKVS